MEPDPDSSETEHVISCDNTDKTAIEQEYLEHSMSSQNSEADTTANMDKSARDLRRKQQGIRDAIEDLEEDDIDAARVPTVERDLDRI